MRRFPRRYPSISSVVPVCPAAGPEYIQSTRFNRFFPPAASCISCNSWICRSSCRSFIICSIRLRSSSAFFCSSHTRSWFFWRTGCQDFFRLRSPPILAMCNGCEYMKVTPTGLEGVSRRSTVPRKWYPTTAAKLGKRAALVRIYSSVLALSFSNLQTGVINNYN